MKLRGDIPPISGSIMELSIYEIIKTAYRSRLLFRTEIEYRELLGVSFDTISDNRDNERAMNVYYDILNRECRSITGESLYALVSSLLEASDVALSVDFDWGDRKQIASRKKFLRKLFRLAIAPGLNLTVDEELKFKPKECDDKLISAIYPNGIERGRTIDMVFLMLLTFGIIKPYGASNMRGRDVADKDARDSLSAMVKLVETLKDDMPQTGVLSKPLIFDSVLDALRSAEADTSHCTPLWFWNLLNTIEDSCMSAASPARFAESMLGFTGYSMSGIWIDNKDEGQNRFWIFPENKFMAFCYSRADGNWVLTPYEFCFYSKKYESEIDDICTFVTAKGNRQILSSPYCTMDNQEIVTAYYELGSKDAYGSFGEIRFESEAKEIPSWFDWNSFSRLQPFDERFALFSKLLSDLYDSNSPYSVLFSNVAPFITDSVDCLIAIDNDYIYVSDIRKPDIWLLKRDMDGSDMYWYLPYYKKEPPRNLINLEVSEDNPVYLFPRNVVSEFSIPDKYKKLFEAVDNTEIGDQISIYQLNESSRKMICLNRFSCIYAIDDLLRDLGRFGVRRLSWLGERQ